MLTSARYAYLGGTDGATGTLIDEQTGKRTEISRAGCSATVFGGPWLLFYCTASPPYLELYTLPTGAWRTVTITAMGYPDALGADWIDFVNDPGCPNSGPCDAEPWHQFQNIDTGQLASTSLTAALQSPAGTTIPDLSSPSLASTLCSPVHTLPIEADEGAVVRGPLTIDGNFVLVTGYSYVSGPTNETYLEHCGSRLHRLLTTTSSDGALFLASSSHVVLWPKGTQQLGGLFLPSLHRFTLTVPRRLARALAAMHGFAEPFLTTRHLYLPVGQQVWSTPIPVDPPTTRQGGA